MKFVLPLLLASLPLAAQTTNPPPAPDGAAPAVNPAPMAPDASEPAVIIAAPPQPPPAPAPLINPMDAPLPDPFSDPVIKQVVARHEKAVNGDKKETKALTADLERWTQDEPQNYLLLAYLGSAYTLDSRDAWPGPGKLTYLHKGGAALDAAVNADPENPAVRFVRAINFYELPALFGKHRAAHDDFEYLLAQLKGTLPMPYTLNADTRQAIYYYAGLSEVQFDKNADAKEAWQAGIALAPQSPLGLKMQAALNKLK